MLKICPTCRHDLGGACCSLNSERECADDDYHPLWEARTKFRDFVDAANYRDLLQPEHFSAVLRDGTVIATYDKEATT